MEAKKLQTEAIASVYDGGRITLRVLRALGWGPELLNLGYCRVRGILNFLNLIPSATRLAATQKELVRQSVRRLAPERGDRVLDIACGRGFAAYYTAAAHPGVDVTAVDLLAENIQVAQTFYGNTRGLSFAVGDAQSLPFKAEAFDKALCLEAAFHFPDRGAFLHEAHRVLRPGGKLVVVDFMWREGGREASAARADAQVVRDTWGFRDFWTDAEYAEVARAQGFALVKSTDWTTRVTRPLQGQFDVLATLAGGKLGRALLQRSHATLRGIGRGEWRDLQRAAAAHRGFHEHSRYVCLELMRMPAAGAKLEARHLHAALTGLLDVKPGPGLRRTIFNVVLLNTLLYLTFRVVPLPGFLAMTALTGLFFSSVMMTTHDGIHHTLTGWAWFDEVVPRLLSYFIFWPHGIYSELHKQHHRLNGRELADPERPTPSRAEVERAGAFGRWALRNRWWLALFVYGGFGMILRHAVAGLRQARSDRRMRRLVMTDAAGIAVAACITLAVIVDAGVTWRYAAYLLVVERIIGFFQQLRSRLEHDGLHGARGSMVKTRLYNCRNVMTTRLGREFFNGLNYHSVHHAFPRVPFYHLAEAHHRIAALCAQAGAPLPTGCGYFRTAVALARTPAVIGDTVGL